MCYCHIASVPAQTEPLATEAYHLHRSQLVLFPFLLVLLLFSGSATRPNPTTPILQTLSTRNFWQNLETSRETLNDVITAYKIVQQFRIFAAYQDSFSSKTCKSSPKNEFFLTVWKTFCQRPNNLSQSTQITLKKSPEARNFSMSLKEISIISESRERTKKCAFLHNSKNNSVLGCRNRFVCSFY